VQEHGAYAGMTVCEKSSEFIFAGHLDRAIGPQIPAQRSNKARGYLGIVVDSLGTGDDFDRWRRGRVNRSSFGIQLPLK
jgi:hypothetical protein